MCDQAHQVKVMSSSAKRRGRCRVVAVRFAQIQSSVLKSGLHVVYDQLCGVKHARFDLLQLRPRPRVIELSYLVHAGTHGVTEDAGAIFGARGDVVEAAGANFRAFFGARGDVVEAAGANFRAYDGVEANRANFEAHARTHGAAVEAADAIFGAHGVVEVTPILINQDLQSDGDASSSLEPTKFEDEVLPQQPVPQLPILINLELLLYGAAPSFLEPTKSEFCVKDIESHFDFAVLDGLIDQLLNEVAVAGCLASRDFVAQGWPGFSDELGVDSDGDASSSLEPTKFEDEVLPQKPVPQLPILINQELQSDGAASSFLEPTKVEFCVKDIESHFDFAVLDGLIEQLLNEVAVAGCLASRDFVAQGWPVFSDELGVDSVCLVGGLSTFQDEHEEGKYWICSVCSMENDRDFCDVCKRCYVEGIDDVVDDDHVDYAVPGPLSFHTIPACLGLDPPPLDTIDPEVWHEVVCYVGKGLLAALIQGLSRDDRRELCVSENGAFIRLCLSVPVQQYTGELVAHWETIAHEGFDSQVVERILKEIDDMQLEVTSLLLTYLQQRQHLFLAGMGNSLHSP
jgi:hypothetical protein